MREPDTLELLPLALSRPREALVRARAVLAADPEPYDASIAHQAVGIVLRDFGDVASAVRELHTAVRLAHKAGSWQREADALATLGVALVFSGRTRSGLAAFDRAVRHAKGLLAGRVLMRLAVAQWTLGRHQDALEALRPAVTILRRADDTIWEARALNARAFVHLALGSVERATVDIARAERLFAAAGQEYESAVARHNRGVIAFRSGDLPAALAFFDEAAGRYDRLGTEVPDLAIDRCAVLLAAGLSRDALQEADRAIRGLEQVRGQATKRAELLLTAANAALAAADTRAALERAGAAHRLFGAQRRPWWRAHAELQLVRARFSAGTASGRLLRQAERTAGLLDTLGAGEASQAHLLAGRTALALGRFQDADRHL
ncbi:MAG TPA: tetratricopeptide repeat protein, partial [Actinomycetes bacterium]|nr:tetratricopeptide repeat protein [Actinomycetes bacterium]